MSPRRLSCENLDQCVPGFPTLSKILCSNNLNEGCLFWLEMSGWRSLWHFWSVDLIIILCILFIWLCLLIKTLQPRVWTRTCVLILTSIPTQTGEVSEHFLDITFSISVNQNTHLKITSINTSPPSVYSCLDCLTYYFFQNFFIHPHLPIPILMDCKMQ